MSMTDELLAGRNELNIASLKMKHLFSQTNMQIRCSKRKCCLQKQKHHVHEN